MDRAILDTDILSELMRDKNRIVRERAASYLTTHGRLTISTLTVMEIVKGLIKAGSTYRLQDF